jgi:DNA-binding transcriptional ArsR family regulator
MKTDALEIDLIVDPAQIRCLAGARRYDILSRLQIAGALSVRELAEWLGAKPSALYHHIQQLLDADLIRADGHRVVNRRREQLYAARSPRMGISRDLRHPAVRDSLTEVAAAFSRQTERDFRRGFAESTVEASGPGRALGFGRAFGRPDAARLKRINALLDEAAALMAQDDGEAGSAVVLSWALTPALRGDD